MVQEIASHFGGIDIVINNAGISIPAPMDSDHYIDAWDKVVSVLLTAQTLMVRAALPYLRASEGGRIVNIASTEGLGATKYGGPYTAVYGPPYLVAPKPSVEAILTIRPPSDALR